MDKVSVLEIMQNLVAINSVFPNEQEISSFIEKFLSEAGLKVEIVATQGERRNIIATSGSKKSQIGFYGHMDTVQPASDYQFDPFKVRCQGDIAYGLGVGDMKGGVACILSAALYASKNSIPASFIFGVDEENISAGAHDLVSSNKLLGFRQLIVAESGQVSDQKQPYSVCFGRRGRFALKVSVAGKAAHAAQAAQGINAIVECAKAASIIDAMQFAEHPQFGCTSIVIDRIEGVSNAFSVPDQCYLQASVLTTPLDKSVDVCRRIALELKSAGIEAQVGLVERTTPYAESYAVDTDCEFVARLKKEIFTPDNITPIYTASVADENVFAYRLGIPVVTLGPIGGGDHTAHEWVSLTSLNIVADKYRTILDQFR